MRRREEHGPADSGWQLGREEPTQHIVNGTLLAESFQTVQHTPHSLPEGARLHEGPAGKPIIWPHCSPAFRDEAPKAEVQSHSPGLLQTVQAEGDTACGLCAESKATQALPLGHTVEAASVSADSRPREPC